MGIMGSNETPLSTSAETSAGCKCPANKIQFDVSVCLNFDGAACEDEWTYPGQPSRTSLRSKQYTWPRWIIFILGSGPRTDGMFRWLGNILSDVMDDDQRIPPPHDLAYINTYESQIYYCCDGAKGTIASNTLVTPLNIVPRCRALRSCPLVLIADTSGCGADLDMARSNNPEAGELRW